MFKIEQIDFEIGGDVDMRFFEYLEMRKKRKLLKRCAKCGRKPVINKRENGWYDIWCYPYSGELHYGIGFTRGSYKKRFETHAKEWNDMTDEIAKELDL